MSLRVCVRAHTQRAGDVPPCTKTQGILSLSPDNSFVWGTKKQPNTKQELSGQARKKASTEMKESAVTVQET